ncbi:MAG: lysophospholipase [Promethearchaeota archaeon]
MSESDGEFGIHPILEGMRVHPVAPAGGGAFFDCESGDRLFYRCWPAGTGTKKVLVGVHGMVAHCDYYVLVADQVVENGVTTYALDLKHHGHSSGAKGDLESLAEVTSQLHEFVTFVRGEHPGIPVFLMGISMGGMIAVHYAAAHPSELAGVVLVAPAVRTNVKVGLKDIPLALKIGVSFLFRKGKPVVDLSKREEPGAGSRNPKRLEYDAADLLRIKKVSARYLLQVNKGVKGAFERGREIACPVLVFQGTDDKVVARDGVLEFFDQLPMKDKTLVEVDGGYHSLFSDPAMLEVGYPALRDWLEKH